jgi:hypothetical protein
MRMIPHQIADILGELECGAAAEYVINHPKVSVRRTLSGVARHWAKVEPESAFNWMLENVGADSEEVYEALYGITLSHRDRTMKFLSHPALAESEVRNRVLNTLGSMLCHEAPKQGLKWFQELPATDQATVLPFLASTLVVQFPETVAELAIKFPPHVQREAAVGIIGMWSLANPEAANAWVTALPSSQLRRELETQSLIRWISVDATGAWARISKYPDEDAVSLLKRKAPHYLSFPNHFSAEGFSIPWPPINDRNAQFIPNDYYRLFPRRGRASTNVGGTDLVDLLLANLPEGQLLAFLELANKSGDTKLEGRVVRHWRSLVAVKDPKRAIDMAKNLGGDDGSNLIHETLTKLMVRDPVLALELAATLEDRREHWISEVARHWAALEPSDSLAFFKSMSSKSGRDIALTGHAEALHQSELKNSLQAARAHFESIPPGEKQDASFKAYARLLLKRAPAKQVAKELDAYLVHLGGSSYDFPGWYFHLKGLAMVRL